ncbi:MAG TPA: GNAT family N-acetyltransferase [Pyrinomonadaceae bacterium]|nr:GNAT family N-acetyltransferase [Pyrinomonadaceae bacterium]
MSIRLAETDSDIERCFPVMSQLRPLLVASDFLTRVRRQAQQDGYLLACLEEEGQVKAVAGFRIAEMLFSGRHLYVDDLVTDTAERSRGYGGALFDWLVEYARAQNCQHFELDSGVQRFEAHRFYFTKRMHISSYHFSLKLDP